MEQDMKNKFEKPINKRLAICNSEMQDQFQN